MEILRCTRMELEHILSLLGAKNCDAYYSLQTRPVIILVKKGATILTQYK